MITSTDPQVKQIKKIQSLLTDEEIKIIHQFVQTVAEHSGYISFDLINMRLLVAKQQMSNEAQTLREACDKISAAGLNLIWAIMQANHISWLN